jgi:hypothetical protein
MEQETLFDNIDAYIWNLLSDDERQTFEKTVAANEDLRAELALRQLENEAFQLADKDQLRAKMKAWRAEEETTDAVIETAETETKVVPIHQGRVAWFTPMRWAAAAAIALLMVFGGRYWATANYGSDALASAFEGKTGSDAPFYGSSGTVTTVDAEALLKQAQSAYQAKNYDQATQIYQTILADKSVDINHREEAEWKLLMALMADKKANAASGFETLLAQMVKDSSHKYHKPALELNEKVQSFWWKVGN